LLYIRGDLYLESKLKRLKISFSKENGRIIIGKSKIDYTILIGLIIFPILVTVGALLFYQISEPEVKEAYDTKIFGFIIFIFSIAVVNIVRMSTKMKANKTLKILGDNYISLKTKEASQRFDIENIIDFKYTMKELENEIFHGNLFLIDAQNQKHLILGFDGENEQYLSDDLQWFSDYLKKHVQLAT